MLKHQHRIAVLKYIKGNIWLLIVPLIRGVLSLKMDLFSWLKTVYMDIFVIITVVGLALLKWHFVRFKIGEKEIYVRSGVIFQRKATIPYNVISCATVHCPFYLKPFRAVEFTFDTEYDIGLKNHKNRKFKLIVSEIDCTQIYKKIPVDVSETTVNFRASKREIIFYSMCFSSTIPGLVYLGTFIIQSSRIVGEKIEIEFLVLVNELTEAVKKFTEDVVAILIVLMTIVAFGWLMSFAVKIARHLNFKASKCRENITIENGHFSSWKYYVKYSSINNVNIRQNLLMKFLKIMSVHINCSGYGNRKNEQSVFVPMTKKSNAVRVMKVLIPDFTLCNIQLKSKRTYMTYVWLPSILIIGVAVATTLFCSIAYRWHEAVQFIGIMLEIPLMYLLAIRIAAKLSTGIGINDKAVTLSYCRATRFHTIIVPKDRIACIKIRRTFFQRVSGCCDVIVYVKGRHKRGHRVRGIKLAEAIWLAKNYDKMWQNAHFSKHNQQNDKHNE
ncbi:MAG: PH domain-containing protein [Oscillospiraceae bacterium]|nr:PH domain-containing protein [Oscillospiraceae bacterium]